MRMLIVSGKDALRKQIGSTLAVERAVRSFARSKKDCEARFLYYDRTNSFKVGKAKKKARAIRQFVSRIEKEWGEIRFLLLLGGDAVVPFFRLRNPCDDSDSVVLSDNPYASRDSDYTIPERACARIPDNRSAAFLIRQLKKKTQKMRRSFGMTAKIWKKASENVYRDIGDVKELKVSPPMTTETFKQSWLQKKRFLYFNLHGSKVSSHWYGQGNGHYPIALTTRNTQKATGIVASESCYGAYIINKSHKESLALSFLANESVCGFCGSTTIAYGPVAPPSREADLLVKHFFEYLQKGLTLGESLRNAKIEFARKMLQRQGFLDDDDQKTLLQFVLYGDPTLRQGDGATRRQGDKGKR